jgi:voltage-gated potassium channel
VVTGTHAPGRRARDGEHHRRGRLRLFFVRHGLIWELALTTITFVWVGLGLTLRTADDEDARRLLSLSGVIGLVYVADWVLRATASGRWRLYIRHHWVVPVLAVGGILPLEPLAQLFRFGLAFVGLRRVLIATGGIFQRFVLLDELIALSLVITTGAGVLVHEFELGVNPRITSFADALWWALVTVSTVGYGDIAPVTPEGRAVAAVLIVVGVGLFAAAVAIIGRYLAEIPRHRRGIEVSADRRLAQLARLERLHAEGALSTAEFLRLIRRAVRGAAAANDSGDED